MTESGKARMFCALDLPESTLALIEGWQRQEVGAHPQWRAVPRPSLHLTLAFLGDRDLVDVPRIERIIAASVAALDPVLPVAGTLMPDPIAKPRRKPRLLAFEVAGTAIPALRAPLASALEAEGLFDAEERDFWAHVTVLRRRGSKGGAGRVAPLQIPSDQAGSKGGGGHAFGAVRVALYRSEIRPGGSEYTCLAARDLPSAGG
jgi:2'-5' RNA ligase